MPRRRIRLDLISSDSGLALASRDIDSVTPMVTELLVEAQSGGTCVVRLVSSAFDTGAD